MAPLKTPLTRAAALKTLELSEPPVCEKQKIERAHRALKRRYLPNEVTPPAAAPYFRRIEKAYSVLETSHVANTDTRKVRGDSSEPIDKRFTALAFFNSGFGSRTPSPTPSGTQDAESLHEDAAPADPDVEPINEAIEAVNDLVAPAFVNAPSQTFKLWLMKEIKYLAIGLAVSLFLNSTGIAVFGEQFIIADKIAAFILGMVLTVAGYVVGFSKGFLQMPESRALLKANSTMPTPRHKLVEVRTVYHHLYRSVRG